MEQKDVIKRLSDYIEYDALTNPSDFAKGANVDVSGFSKMLKGKQTITVNTKRLLIPKQAVQRCSLSKH